MSGFPPGRYYALVANADGTRDAIGRNSAIGEARRFAAASNIGEPAMVVVMVPKGTEDEALERIAKALTEPDGAA